MTHCMKQCLHVGDVVLQVLTDPRELGAVCASNRDRVDLAEPPQFKETKPNHTDLIKTLKSGRKEELV